MSDYSSISDPILPQQKAYFVAGHGSELDGTFTVPEGSIIIVKAHSGEETYDRYFSKFCKLPISVLQDPLREANTIKLIESFGTLAIYTPGDQCPQFDFNLEGCYPSKYYKLCDTYGSGLLDLELVKSDTLCNSYKRQDDVNFDHLTTDESIVEFIGDLYKHSVLPTRQQIVDTLHERLKDTEFMNKFKFFSTLLKVNLLFLEITKLTSIKMKNKLK